MLLIGAVVLRVRIVMSPINHGEQQYGKHFRVLSQRGLERQRFGVDSDGCEGDAIYGVFKCNEMGMCHPLEIIDPEGILEGNSICLQVEGSLRSPHEIFLWGAVEDCRSASIQNY